MTYPIYSIEKCALPEQLREIPNPPETLYARGALPDWSKPMLSVVGSRRYSPYGKSVCEYLIGGLAGSDIYIVSGLALGIDSIAHNAALSQNIKTIAIPGSGLDDSVIYPRMHRPLAQYILNHGGTLLSEFDATTKAAQWTFPQRNRIMAGLSHAVLIVECELKSGTHITARLATEYNRDVLTVPGSIFAPTSDGPHSLLKLGATPITSPEDILEALHLPQPEEKVIPLSAEERRLLDVLPASRKDISKKLHIPEHALSMLIATMEIKGLVTERLGTIVAHTHD